MNEMLRVLDSGIIFINGQPELKYIHAMQPSIVVLSETEYLSVFKQGTAIESVDSKLAQIRSLDGGKTWQSEESISQTIFSSSPVYSYFCPHMTKLKDDRLLVLSVRFRRDDPGKRCYNPETGGCLFPETTLFISKDRGNTWQGPHVIDISGRYAYSGGPVVELNDGRWMVIFETWKEFDNPSPLKTKIFALFSSDEGKSWGDETVVFEDDNAQKAFWDVTYSQLSDGTILGLAWTHDLKASRDLPHHRIVSTDNGKTWHRPQPTNRHGQFNITLELPDGRLFGVYNHRNTERPGIYTALSNDQGKSWDIENQVQIWDAMGQANIGFPAGTTFIEDLATFAFGKSDACMINDNEIIIAFWATKSCLTHTRWCRVAIGSAS